LATALATRPQCGCNARSDYRNQKRPFFKQIQRHCSVSPTPLRRQTLRAYNPRCPPCGEFFIRSMPRGGFLPDSCFRKLTTALAELIGNARAVFLSVARWAVGNRVSDAEVHRTPGLGRWRSRRVFRSNRVRAFLRWRLRARGRRRARSDHGGVNRRLRAIALTADAHHVRRARMRLPRQTDFATMAIRLLEVCDEYRGTPTLVAAWPGSSIHVLGPSLSTPPSPNRSSLPKSKR
jgi:hypothetical protein